MTTVFEHPDFDAHEEIVFAHDPVTGLRAIIAVHDTSLGPALGGCRIWDYASEAAALADVLRLSRGMSYKAALAGLPLGGGKAVVLTAPGRPKTPAMMRAMGRAVDGLGVQGTAIDGGVDQRRAASRPAVSWPQSQRCSLAAESQGARRAAVRPQSQRASRGCTVTVGGRDSAFHAAREQEQEMRITDVVVTPFRMGRRDTTWC